MDAKLEKCNLTVMLSLKEWNTKKLAYGDAGDLATYAARLAHRFEEKGRI